MYKDDEKQMLIVIVTITNIIDTKQCINLFYKEENKHDNVFVDWDLISGNIKFPMDEINVPNDIIKAFNDMIEKELSKDILKNQFKERIRSPKRTKETQGVPSINKIPLIDTADSSSRIIPDKPDFEDEYEMRGKPKASGIPNPNYSIGDDDLFPGGIRDPSINPMMDPLRDGRDGGMYPSNNHPLFRRTGDSANPMGSRYDDPLGANPDNMDLIGQGLPGFRKSSGGSGNMGGFSGFGNHHPFGGI